MSSHAEYMSLHAILFISVSYISYFILIYIIIRLHCFIIDTNNTVAHILQDTCPVAVA